MTESKLRRKCLEIFGIPQSRAASSSSQPSSAAETAAQVPAFRPALFWKSVAESTDVAATVPVNDGVAAMCLPSVDDLLESCRRVPLAKPKSKTRPLLQAASPDESSSDEASSSSSSSDESSGSSTSQVSAGTRRCAREDGDDDQQAESSRTSDANRFRDATPPPSADLSTPRTSAPASQMGFMGANPNCFYIVDQAAFGGYCCQKCHWVYTNRPCGKRVKKHGPRCNHVTSDRSVARAEPIPPDGVLAQPPQAQQSHLSVEASRSCEVASEDALPQRPPKSEAAGGYEVLVPVDQMFQTHDSVAPQFRDGRRFEDLVMGLNRGTVKPLEEKFLKLDVYKWPGKDAYYTINNRRLMCLKKHQDAVRQSTGSVFIRARVLGTLPSEFANCLQSDPHFLKFVRSFTTNNGGRSVHVRGGNLGFIRKGRRSQQESVGENSKRTRRHRQKVEDSELHFQDEHPSKTYTL
eukprot:TRINITY_DN20381_c0_g1_i1.p1 TRINITY_DN20381_c0_g1~~TRINITY_DN20381_c0_g1_i1.p1  ORF type:complete len:465 (+),score=63.00 TRINITY_DN20381_c0_g1_i1:82-1476(+)